MPRTVQLDCAVQGIDAERVLASVQELSEACEPSVSMEEAPKEWDSLPDGVRSLSCEVQAIAAPVQAIAAPVPLPLNAQGAEALHWVYRFDAATLPRNTHGLARISVLLRGAEKTGMLSYTHSVVLAHVEPQDGVARLLDVAETPDGADDLRVLEFPHFPAERPLFFGRPEQLQQLEVHVHLLSAPPPSIGRDMIKVVGDAVFAPYTAQAEVRHALERPDGLPSVCTPREPAVLVKEASGTLHLQCGAMHPLATKRYEQARVALTDASEDEGAPSFWPSVSYGISAQMSHLGLSESKSAARAWGSQQADQASAPLWLTEMERCADILPTLYTTCASK